MATKKKQNPWRNAPPGISPELRKAFPTFSSHKPDSAVKKLVLNTSTEDQSLAPSQTMVNWRAAAPIPGDQGSFNTCTSFAVAFVIETLHYLKNHTRIKLAPSYIHSCLLGRPLVSPASPMVVANAVAAGGVAYGFPNDYPFPVDHCSTGNVYRVSHCVELLTANEAMNALAYQGPVLADMYIDPTFFTLQTGAIYQYQPSDYDRLHSIAVIGYDLSQRCWLIANSFGDGWCDKGFARVAFGSGGLLDTRSGWKILL